MGDLIYLWTIAQLFWVYFVKLKPLHILAFLLMHGLLFWVMLKNYNDLRPLLFSFPRHSHPMMLLSLLWSIGLISLVGKICDKDLKDDKEKVTKTEKKPARRTKRDKEREDFHQKPRS